MKRELSPGNITIIYPVSGNTFTIHSKYQNNFKKDSYIRLYIQFLLVNLVVQLLSRVWLLATPWTAACQASLSFTISWSLLKLMSIESVMPSNYLILCHPLLLLPSIFPSIRVFSNDLAVCIGWPRYSSFSFSINLELIDSYKPRISCL